jgi:cytochrome P450
MFGCTTGEKWRKMRKLQTTLFSSGKIRQYSKQLAEAAYDFVHSLSIRANEHGRVKIDTRQ